MVTVFLGSCEVILDTHAYYPQAFKCFTIWFQIQHPRSRIHRFDLVITPQHDYYPLMPEAQEQIPLFLRRWVTPRKPPDKHVVCYCLIDQRISFTAEALYLKFVSVVIHLT